MPENYYADAEAPEPQMPEQEPEPTEGESDSETAVLPKSILAGKTFKPGEEIVLKIESIQDDSVVVSYATGKGGEDEGYSKEESTPEPQASAPNPMSSMMY